MEEVERSWSTFAEILWPKWSWIGLSNRGISLWFLIMDSSSLGIWKPKGYMCVVVGCVNLYRELTQWDGTCGGSKLYRDVRNVSKIVMHYGISMVTSLIRWRFVVVVGSSRGHWWSFQGCCVPSMVHKKTKLWQYTSCLEKPLRNLGALVVYDCTRVARMLKCVILWCLFVEVVEVATLHTLLCTIRGLSISGEVSADVFNTYRTIVTDLRQDCLEFI